MKKCLPILIMACLSLSSCDKRTPFEQAQEGAMVAAQVYFRCMIDGQYGQFLAGKAGADSIAEGYRSQLLEAYKQFMAQQQKKHGGIVGVEALRANADSTVMTDNGTMPRMQVILQITFGDGGYEEIVVPMGCYNGQWLMD